MKNFEDVLEDVARKAILDPKTISDIMDCDQIEFARQVALMVAPPKYEKGMSIVGECAALRAEFEDFLIEQAKELFYVRQSAQAELNDEMLYGSAEGLPTGWKEAASA